MESKQEYIFDAESIADAHKVVETWVRDGIMPEGKYDIRFSLFDYFGKFIAEKVG